MQGDSEFWLQHPSTVVAKVVQPTFGTGINCPQIQGAFFNGPAPKISKCQPESKFRQFYKKKYQNLLYRLTLGDFEGGTAKKNTLYKAETQSNHLTAINTIEKFLQPPF